MWYKQDVHRRLDAGWLHRARHPDSLKRGGEWGYCFIRWHILVLRQEQLSLYFLASVCEWETKRLTVPAWLPSNDLITTDDGHWTTCVISRMTPLEAGWASCSPWGAWASWAPGGQTWLCSPYSIWPIKWNYWYYWPIRWVLIVLNNWQITERHY